ncbi:hypothetical protein Tco_0085486 [Tanacetum coccineum]
MTDQVANSDKENQTNKMVKESLSAELERYKERVVIFEQRQNVDLNKRKKLIDSQMDDLIRNKNAKLEAFKQEIDTLKETLSNNVKEKESLSTTLNVFKTESKYTNKEIVLEKQNKELDNIICKLYRSIVIVKEHSVISVTDDEETLILEEESRSKMLDKQNDPISIKKKSKISPIDYSKLNKIKEDFVLKDIFNAFDKTLLEEITKVQTVFNQMEAAVDQCSVDKNVFEIQIKQLRIDNDQLLNQIMSQKIMHIVENSVDIFDVKKSCVNDCKKYCISLELTTQLNQEIFQRKNSGENLNAPTFNQLFEINELKAQSQEKDMVIRKLKDMIKSLSGKDSLENVKKDIDEIETINIELEHSVAKLLSENKILRKEREHLKSIYKDQFNSIRKTRVQSKEYCDLFKLLEINLKVSSNLDLNAQLKKGRTFTIDGNRFPLTRITSNKIVPPKESTIAPVVTSTQGILVYSRRTKASRSVGSSSKVKNVEPNTPNSMEPNQSWGSNISDVPSSSLTDCRLSKLFFGIWTPAAHST